MLILTRYVLFEFLVPLCYCLGGFVSIYVLFELFGSFSRLMATKLPFMMVVSYFAGYLAPYFHYLAPAGLMLATLYTMWSFCRHSEIIAMRASGVSFMTIVKPLLAVSIAMALFVLYVNEIYVPRRAQWASAMKSERFDLSQVSKADNLVFRNAKEFRTWNIDSLIDEDGYSLSNVRVTQDRKGGVRLWNIMAERADYLDGEWWFTNPVVQHYDVTGKETSTPTPELDALTLRSFVGFRERPSDFLMLNRDWKYNSIHDRLRYLRSHKDLTAKVRNDYLYDIWSQIMAPWACVVITLFAIPAGIASGRQSVFKGILGALGMFFSFYILVILGMILAKNGILPAIPAAVLPYLIFLGLGAHAFYKQR